MYILIINPEAIPMPFHRHFLPGAVMDFAISAIKKCAHMQRLVNRLHTSINSGSDMRANYDR